MIKVTLKKISTVNFFYKNLAKVVEKAIYGSICFLLLALPSYNLLGQTSLKAQITVSVTVGSVQPSPIPQDWIDSFFGANYQVTSTSDYDSDGQFDYLEYYAGTDPTDGASRLKVTSTELSGNDAIIIWKSTPDSEDDPPEAPGNRFYRLFRCGPNDLNYLASSGATIESLDELIANPPNDESSLISLGGEILSEGETTSYTDANVRNEFPLFYRVFLSKPEPQLP